MGEDGRGDDQSPIGRGKKPSGQKSRRRSGSPALLKGGEVVLTSVTKAKTLELFALNGFGFPSEGTPASTIQPSDVVRQLLLMARILLPPGGIGGLFARSARDSRS